MASAPGQPNNPQPNQRRATGLVGSLHSACKDAGFLQCSTLLLSTYGNHMLWYVVEAVTVHTAKRLVSFSDHKAAVRYAHHIATLNPTSFWVGVVDQDEWYHCFA